LQPGPFIPASAVIGALCRSGSPQQRAKVLPALAALASGYIAATYGLLPQPFETLTQFDPVHYMISLVRYGFVGFSAVSIPLAMVAPPLSTATA